MLFRLLLTLSLVGAWSLPALGCLVNPTRKPLVDLDVKPFDLDEKSNVDDMFDELPQKLFPERRNKVIMAEKETGGGTWSDSKGREGTYTSEKHTRLVKVRDCGKGWGRRIGCSENATFHLYVIELDDGRKEWFTWVVTGMIRSIRFSESRIGIVAMKYAAEREDEIVITAGDFTLTLVEEEIEGIPNSIVLQHSSSRRILSKIQKEVWDAFTIKPRTRD